MRIKCHLSYTFHLCLTGVPSLPFLAVAIQSYDDKGRGLGLVETAKLISSADSVKSVFPCPAILHPSFFLHITHLNLELLSIFIIKPIPESWFWGMHASYYRKKQLPKSKRFDRFIIFIFFWSLAVDSIYRNQCISALKLQWCINLHQYINSMTNEPIASIQNENVGHSSDPFWYCQTPSCHPVNQCNIISWWNLWSSALHCTLLFLRYLIHTS